jgi:hypothetical protein
MRLRRMNPICNPSLAPRFLNLATGGLARLRRENDPSDRLNPYLLAADDFIAEILLSEVDW